MVQLYSRVSRSLALPISTMPRFIIPLADKLNSSICGMPATFARNSTATYIDANGILQTAAINVPRFQNGRYLAEANATNMLRYSELLTNSYWLKTNLSVVEDATKGSFKLTNTVSGGCFTYSTNIVATNGVYYTQSAVLEKGNTNFASLAFAGALSPTLLPYAIFNLDLGAVAYTKDCVATITQLADNKFRCSVTAYGVSSANGPFGIITPSRDGAARLIGVLGDYIYATKVQAEVGQLMTSYIPTTSAPVTRVADVLHYDVSSVITQGQGSLYCEFLGGNVDGHIRSILYISDDTIANRLYMAITTTGSLTVLGDTGGAEVVSIASTSILSTLNKAVLTYKDNEVILYCNGTKRGEDLSCTIPTNFTTLSVACSHDGTLQLNSEIGNVKYFKEVLTPAEAFKLTTV